jgi:hypothetical protein
MDAETVRAVVDAVRTLGFPVVTAIGLAWWQFYQDRTFRQERRDERVAFVQELQANRTELGRKLDEQTRLLERLAARAGQ